MISVDNDKVELSGSVREIVEEFCWLCFALSEHIPNVILQDTFDIATKPLSENIHKFEDCPENVRIELLKMMLEEESEYCRDTQGSETNDISEDEV